MSLEEESADIRSRALAEARLWLGTPYRHQASCRGAGCDCLGLLRGVVRGLYGREPEEAPDYAPDWSAAGREELREAGRRWLEEIAIEAALPGDVLLFRWRDGVPARHVGLLADGQKLIHAYERVGVIESPLVPAWRRRISNAFRFPEEPSWQL
ncbi:NlpC/P60 family protein [Roseibium litorale]|uniref:NlpC/P60 family protein n=1 Tax=Roseibium litorale TaxID=2803841 RepID=UPI0031B57352